MFDYLQQFNSLPPELRAKVSSPQAIAAITALENKYRIDLAATVMKVMIKSISLKDLPAFFISESSLTPATANELTGELKNKIFILVASHLGLAQEARLLDLDKDINLLIKETGLILPSEILVGRFKNTLSTYLRGIRNRIDTRNSLAKDVKIGGLNLTESEIDRVLKICDTRNIKPATTNSGLNRLNQIISQADPAVFSKGKVEEYDLKKVIASGQIKKPVQPDELAAPEKILNLPRVDHQIDLPLAEPDKLKLSAPLIPLKPQAIPTPTPTPRPLVTPAIPIIKPKITEPIKVVESVKPVAPIRFSQVIKAIDPKTVAAQPPKPSQAVAASRPAATPTEARPQMHDIKPMPKVMGPIEELQFLDVVNFRRLGKTATEASEKVLAKIKLLENDGYDKMVSGVKAWRQSPVNRAYLRLGQEAVIKGVGLKEIINLRRQSGQECLVIEEIEAIVNLNSRLIF